MIGPASNAMHVWLIELNLGQDRHRFWQRLDGRQPIQWRHPGDLSTFHADGGTDGEGTSVAFTVAPDTPTTGTTTVTATVTGLATTKLFVRVQVTQG